MFWFRTIQHLLPTGAAWNVVVDKALRRFFEGVSETPQDAQTFADGALLDVFPDSTRRLDDWEEQFFLQGELPEAQRRIRLAETWRELGGQSPGYVGRILAAHGFGNLQMHPWTDPGFAVTAEGRYVARDPRLYLTETGIAERGGVVPAVQDAYRPVRYTAEAGEPEALAGVSVAQAGNGPGAVEVRAGKGYLLVNIVPGDHNPFRWLYECGEPEAQCGQTNAQAGNFRGARGAQPDRQYRLPDDNRYWPYFAYVGPTVFGQIVEYPRARKAELDRLLLRILPYHLYIGVFVEYT